MGNLGKQLNFPLVWTRKGAVEPLRSIWFCAERFTCWGGNFAPFSESTACRVVRYFWCLREWRLILCEEAPYLAVATYLASWASNVSDYCGKLTRWDTLTGELGEPCRPEASALAFVWGGQRHAELTGVSVRKCEWLVRSQPTTFIK